MVVIIILGVLFVLFVFLAIYGFKKGYESLSIDSTVLALFLGIFIYSTVVLFHPNKEEVRNRIKYYNSLKEKVEMLKELDPDCRDIVIETFVPGLKSEVESMNNYIERNRSRIGTWNEYFISKDIANLEKIKY